MSNYIVKIAHNIGAEASCAVSAEMYSKNKLSRQWWAKYGKDEDQAEESPHMGENVKVAILDTGCGPHNELKLSGGVNFTGGSQSDYTDRQGHGTHVASITQTIAPESEIYAVKVLGDNGSGEMDGIIMGMRWAIDNGMNVINMSLGSPGYYQPFHNIIKEANKKGITVVCAAGNEGDGIVETEELSFPGALQEVICVGSISKNENISRFSNSNRQLDVVAPGQNIYALAPNNKYVSLSGTSMATPFVSGIVALILGERSEYTPIDVRFLLESTASDAGAEGRDDLYGSGIVNLDKILKQL